MFGIINGQILFNLLNELSWCILCNNAAVLCNLTRQARLIFVLKHITSIYICVDLCISFFTLTLTFLCLLRGLPLPPLNKMFWFSNPYHSRKLLFTPSYEVVSECHKTQLDFKNVLLDSTMCSNSFELLAFSSHIML